MFPRHSGPDEPRLKGTERVIVQQRQYPRSAIRFLPDIVRGADVQRFDSRAPEFTFVASEAGADITQGHLVCEDQKEQGYVKLLTILTVGSSTFCE